MTARAIWIARLLVGCVQHKVLEPSAWPQTRPTQSAVRTPQTLVHGRRNKPLDTAEHRSLQRGLLCNQLTRLACLHALYVEIHDLLDLVLQVVCVHARAGVGVLAHTCTLVIRQRTKEKKERKIIIKRKKEREREKERECVCEDYEN